MHHGPIRSAMFFGKVGDEIFHPDREGKNQGKNQGKNSYPDSIAVPSPSLDCVDFFSYVGTVQEAVSKWRQ